MRFFAAIVSLWILMLSGGVVAEGDMDPNARDLLILTDWFEGEFDNEEQRWFYTRNGGEGEPKHLRMHAAHKRLDLPNIGEHVFYLQHHINDDPTDVARQRIAVFISEPEDQSIRMKQGFFKDPGKALNAHLDPSKLADLTADDIFFIENCDIFWRREADQYVANMKPKACQFGEGDLLRYSVHRWTLSETKLWLVDSSFLVSNDSLHVGLPVDEPFRMRRSKIFECEVTFRTEDGREARSVKDIRLHSQGGLVWFDPDENGDVYGLRMRDKEYPFYSERPDFLLLSLQKKGQATMVGYALTDVEARRVGFNLGSVLGHCHREGYDFRQTLDQLP
ncbi:MAG: chromophore lyase CpcT/CpeT [Rhodospirillaceae bacterium]